MEGSGCGSITRHVNASYNVRYGLLRISGTRGSSLAVDRNACAGLSLLEGKGSDLIRSVLSGVRCRSNPPLLRWIGI